MLTKKTFIQTPSAIEEPVEKINFEFNLPEHEKEEPRVEATSGVRVEAATPQQETEGTKSVEEEKREADLNYTFGKQEPIGELYQKVLDAIASYRQEKADIAYYQAYRARTAESPEEAAEAACQSFSPTLEAEENLDDLINRAEKSASDRARILKRIRVEASEVQGTLEEVRWKFCELSQEEKSTNEAGQTQSYVSKTNKSRIRTESRSSYQEEECSEAGSEKRVPRKEEEKVYQGAQRGRLSKEGKNSWERTERTHVLNGNEAFNEEFPENRNKITEGAAATGDILTLNDLPRAGMMTV